MKYAFMILVCLAIQYTACTKNHDKTRDCTLVTITSSAPGCGGWGIVIDGTKYPSRNIPSEFQQDGMIVCVNYELYEDLRMCACCGGTWANIKSIKRL
jgi:hypothetical protein